MMTKKDIKQKIRGYLYHRSKVFSHFVVEVDENGEENQVPVFVGNTLKENKKQIRRANLIHNNQKRRRMIKMGLI